MELGQITDNLESQKSGMALAYILSMMTRNNIESKTMTKQERKAKESQVIKAMEKIKELQLEGRLDWGYGQGRLETIAEYAEMDLRDAKNALARLERAGKVDSIVQTGKSWDHWGKCQGTVKFKRYSLKD